MTHKYDLHESIVYCTVLLLFSPCIFSKTFQVGAGRTYTLPSQVSSLVSDGDTVAIDAGFYTDCTTWTKNNLILKGVGGYAHLQNKSCGGKAIWIIQGSNTIVERIEFSGATVVDKNGAGIRMEGTNLTIRRCYFHDNEDGILAGDNANSNILIEYSEFANNGYGDGYSHNMYINHIASFTIQYCYVHHAKIGHDIKSRAYKTYILYNRISDESTGTASRNIDLPNGGLVFIIGNIIHHGPQTQNSNLCGYGLEGLTNPIKNLYIVNNTFVNERSTGLFVNIPASGTDTLFMINNNFAGVGTLLSGKSVILEQLANFINTNISQFGFTNAAGYDYHLTGTSLGINQGFDPGVVNGLSLTPASEYVHPSNMKPRQSIGTIDIGAYEYVPPVSVQDKQIYLPNSVKLYQNYPNPFSEYTTITLTPFSPLQNTSEGLFGGEGTGERVAFKVFDLLGREILDLTNEAQSYSFITIHASQLPSNGIYFYRLTIRMQTYTRAFVLNR